LESTNQVVKYRAEPLGAEIEREHRVLYSSVGVLDGFLGGFESSKLALLASSDRFVFDFAYTLCTRAVLDLHADVVYVDGGNRMNPHVISDLCKRYRVDKEAVLSRVSLARAFTAYQMVTIIDEKLEDTINELNAEVVLASCLPTLFYDEDLYSSESRNMYKQCIEKLEKLTNEYDLITIITDYSKRADKARSAVFNKLLHKHVDKIVRFEARERRKAMRVWDEAKYSFIDYYPVTSNQTVLEDFLEG
jgi:hypothetical protein